MSHTNEEAAEELRIFMHAGDVVSERTLLAAIAALSLSPSSSAPEGIDWERIERLREEDWECTPLDVPVFLAAIDSLKAQVELHSKARQAEETNALKGYAEYDEEIARLRSENETLKAALRLFPGAEQSKELSPPDGSTVPWVRQFRKFEHERARLLGVPPPLTDNSDVPPAASEPGGGKWDGFCDHVEHGKDGLRCPGCNPYGPNTKVSP